MFKFILISIISILSISPLLAKDCAKIWQNGFPDPRYSSFFDCTLFGEETVAGTHFQVYHYAENWQDDPKEQALLPLMVQASKDSISFYKNHGKLIPIVLIYSGEDARLPDTTAEVNDRGIKSGEPCPVIVYKEALIQEESHFKQIIAHEVFHCFQYSNFKKQMQKPGSNPQENSQITDWWVEGSADFFSNLVYPKANYEHNKSNQYDQDIPLHKQGSPYSTSIFFQSLYNNPTVDITSIIQFFDVKLPINGKSEQQQQALSTFPMMSNMFHTFAREYSSFSIKDSGGGTVPTFYTMPYPAELVPKDPKSSYTYNFRPYTIHSKIFKFPKGGTFNISFKDLDFMDYLRVSWRKINSSDNQWNDFWSWVPLKVETSCSEEEAQYEFIYTSAAGSKENRKFELEIEYEETPCPCKSVLPYDQCLSGSWTLDNESLKEQLLKLPSAQERMKNLMITGKLKFKFDSNREMEMSYNDLTLDYDYYMDEERGTIHVTNALKGDSFNKFGFPQENRVCTTQTTGGVDIATTIYMGENPTNTNVHVNAENTSFDYKCGGDLTITGTFPVAIGNGQTTHLQVRFTK